MTCAGSDVLVRPIDPAGLPEVVTLDEAAALLGWTRQATVERRRRRAAAGGDLRSLRPGPLAVPARRGVPPPRMTTPPAAGTTTTGPRPAGLRRGGG